MSQTAPIQQQQTTTATGATMPPEVRLAWLEFWVRQEYATTGQWPMPSANAFNSLAIPTTIAVPDPSSPRPGLHASGAGAAPPAPLADSQPSQGYYYQQPLPVTGWMPPTTTAATSPEELKKSRAYRRREKREGMKTGYDYTSGWSWELAGQILARPEVKTRLETINRETHADPLVRADDRRVLSFMLYWSAFAPFRAANIVAIGTDKMQAELGISWDRVRVGLETRRSADSRTRQPDPTRRKANSNIWRLIGAGVLYCYSLATLGLLEETETDRGLGLAKTAPAWSDALADLQNLHDALLHLPKEEGGQGQFFGRRCIQYTKTAGNFYRLPDWVRTLVKDVQTGDVNPFGHNKVRTKSEEIGDMNPLRTNFGHNSDLVRANNEELGQTEAEGSPNEVGLIDLDLVNENDIDAHAQGFSTHKVGSEGQPELNPLQKAVERRLKSVHLDISYGATFVQPWKIAKLVSEQGCTPHDVDQALDLIKRDVARSAGKNLENPTGLFLMYLDDLIAQRTRQVNPVAGSSRPATTRPDNFVNGNGKFHSAQAFVSHIPPVSEPDYVRDGSTQSVEIPQQQVEWEATNPRPEGPQPTLTRGTLYFRLTNFGFSYPSAREMVNDALDEGGLSLDQLHDVIVKAGYAPGDTRTEFERLVKETSKRDV